MKKVPLRRKTMKQKIMLCITALLMVSLLGGCAQHPPEISSLDVTQTPSHFEPETSGKNDFRYIYRGFTAVPLNDSEMLERFMEFGEQTIETEEEWSAFMASYCPGIPYDEPWDFSEDYLLAYITEGASPAYTNSNTITSLVWEDGRFTPKYENDPANFVYALNSEEYTHFFVEVIALSRDIYASEGENYQSVSPEKTANGAIFKTVFRGFTMVSLDDRAIFERFSGFGTKVISTEENWNAFKSAFCPGIPCNEPVDFTSHGLIVSVMMGARPTYIGASKIVGMDPEYGCPVFEDSVTNCIYALNTENYTHFYVAVIAIVTVEVLVHRPIIFGWIFWNRWYWEKSRGSQSTLSAMRMNFFRLL